LKRLLIIFFVSSFYLFADDTFRLDLSKKEAYLNEPIVATFRLTYLNKSKPRYIKFEDLRSRDFLIKKVSESKESDKNYTTISYNYIIIPQKSGSLEFRYQRIKVARVEPKTSMIIWKELESKPKKIDVLPISNSNLIAGDLALNVSKKELKNSATEIEITLKGVANFDDIEPFKLKLNSATIYSNKPKVEYNITKGVLFGRYTQKFVIISSSDVKIDKFKFSYFNTNTKMVENLESKKIEIKSPNSRKKIDYLWLFIGVVAGVFLTVTFFYIKRVKRVLPLKSKIKACVTRKCLYKILLPYAHIGELRDIIDKLENSIYLNSDIDVSKKEILKALKEADI